VEIWRGQTVLEEGRWREPGAFLRQGTEMEQGGAKYHAGELEQERETD
jgi:hypothetical protein